MLTDEICEQKEPAATTMTSGATAHRRIRLLDTLPCNLRTGHAFLSSEFAANWPTDSIVDFARCYGFLMYDRTEKLQLLRSRCSPHDTATQDLLYALSECQNVKHMKTCVQTLLRRTDDLLARGRHLMEQQERSTGRVTTVDLSLLDQDTSEPSVMSEPPRNHEEVLLTDVLQLARNSLRDIYECTCNGDFLRDTIVANDLARHVISATDARSEAIAACEQTWRLRDRFDAEQRPLVWSFDEAFSAVVRDCVITTALQTHTMSLVSLRVALLVVFLVEQSLVDNTATLRLVPTLEEIRQLASPATGDAYDALLRDYMNHTFSVDALLATIGVFIFRSYLANACEWPLKVREANGRTVSLETFAPELRKLVHTTTLRRRRADVRSWLRVLRRRTLCAGSSPQWRLYANFDVLVEMYERVSLATKVGHGRLRNSAGTEVPAAVRVPIHDDALKAQFEEHRAFRDECRAIVNACLRTHDGRDARRFAAVRLCELDESLHLGADTERSYTQSLVEAIDRVLGAVVDMFLYTLVSCVRQMEADAVSTIDLNVYRATNEETSDSTLEYDARNDSFVLLKLHAMAQMQQARVTSAKLDRLFRRAVDMWRSRIGVCDLRQLSETLLCLVDFFRDPTAAAAAPPPPPPLVPAK